MHYLTEADKKYFTAFFSLKDLTGSWRNLRDEYAQNILDTGDAFSFC